MRGMRRATIISPWLLAFCTACSPGGPSLIATDIEAVAPLPGRTFSAAYLTLHNQGPIPLTVSRVSSTHFASVEIHESQVVDDVIRMRKLDSITIDAGERIKFESGGKHLMLIDPKAGLDVGDSITLQFNYDNEGMLIVSAPLRKRK